METTLKYIQVYKDGVYYDHGRVFPDKTKEFPLEPGAVWENFFWSEKWILMACFLIERRAECDLVRVDVKDVV